MIVTRKDQEKLIKQNAKHAKYSVLSNFCYADFLAYYTLENKSNKLCEYQPDELDENVTENDHGECS